jgi:cyclase
MRLGLFLCSAALALAPAGAQERDFSGVEIKVEKLAPGVAVLFGAGGNIGLSYGDDGNVIIDDQFAPLSDKIVASIHTLDPDPVKFVINTHWHGDHTGGNANFGRAGAVIIAQDNVRARLATEQLLKGDKIPASPKEALPVITYANGVTVHLNGDDLRVIHVANAHTDGDSIIRWTKADVLHMGDTFWHGDSFPFVDLESGGSIDGMIAAATEGIELAGPNTKIVPGHGTIGTRADLVAFRDMLVDIRDKVAAGMKTGRTLAQIRASKPAAKYGMPDGFIKPDQFVETVYTSLKNPPAKHAH